MILHIPHASKIIPTSELEAFLLSPCELENEILRMTDCFTDELFAMATSSTPVVRFPVSRLLVDPERFLDDELEPMARVGMGVVYLQTSEGTKLREQPSASERKRLLEKYYYPHHRRLEMAVEGELNKYGNALIIDCHSFPSRPRRYQNRTDSRLPDISLGTDIFHTPNRLLDSASVAFSQNGLSVAVNNPYSGSIVPIKYFRSESRVWSLMIEVNRGLYMNEEDGKKLANFDRVQEIVRQTLVKLNEIAMGDGK